MYIRLAERKNRVYDWWILLENESKISENIYYNRIAFIFAQKKIQFGVIRREFHRVEGSIVEPNERIL